MIQQRVDAGDGTPIVVRTADGPSARTLEAAGARLHGAAHPGVVQVLASAGTADGGWELRTAHGGTPLSTIVAIDPVRLAAVGAGVATTLADLHEHGIVHGRLTAARVLLGAHDRPTLCGFGSTAPQVGVDEDVAALGRLLLDRLDDRSESRPVVLVARRMRAILDQTVDPSPARRPSMRRLAGALAELGSTPVPVLRRPTGRRDRPRLSERRLGTGRQLAAVGASIVVLTLGVAQLRFGRATPTGSELSTQSARAAAGAVIPEDAPTEPSTTVDGTGGGQCALIEGAAAVVVALGCPHALAIDGTTVTIDGHAYTVGEANDVLAVGSWRCAGDATIVLLRPATGEVFVFPAATDVEVTVHPLAVVPGATTFRTAAPGPRCQELQVLDAAGAATPLELRPT